jgi:hypothetical protein
MNGGLVLPASSLLGLVAPSPVFPPFRPVIEPPPPSPYGQIALIAIAAATAVSILIPKTPKKQKFGDVDNPKNRVIKLQDAFDIIDETVTGKQIGYAVLIFLKANLAAFGHPSWISLDEAFAEVSEEVTQKLRNDLKVAMAEKVLQQRNSRLDGHFDKKITDIHLLDFITPKIFPERCNQRRGSMHHDKKSSGSFPQAA